MKQGYLRASLVVILSDQRGSHANSFTALARSSIIFQSLLFPRNHICSLQHHLFNDPWLDQQFGQQPFVASDSPSLSHLVVCEFRSAVK